MIGVAGLLYSVIMDSVDIMAGSVVLIGAIMAVALVKSNGKLKQQKFVCDLYRTKLEMPKITMEDGETKNIEEMKIGDIIMIQNGDQLHGHCVVLEGQDVKSIQNELSVPKISIDDFIANMDNEAEKHEGNPVLLSNTHI